MIDPHPVRHALRNACGEADYRRFVLELLGPCQAHGRLRWWQETKWEPVRAALGLELLAFAELTALFRHCPVHDAELQAESLPILYGTFAPTPRSELEEAARLFPLASTRAYGPCWGGEATHREVLYCPGCRAALNASRTVADSRRQ